MKRGTLFVIALATLVSAGLCSIPATAHANDVNFTCTKGKHYDGAGYSMTQGEGGLFLTYHDTIEGFQYQHNVMLGDVDVETHINNERVAVLYVVDRDIIIKVFQSGEIYDKLKCKAEKY